MSRLLAMVVCLGLLGVAMGARASAPAARTAGTLDEPETAAATAEAAPADGGPSREVAPAARIDLKSQTLVVEHRKHRAVFGGGVVATRGDLVVRCPTLVAYYDASAKIREVVCQGPVEATEGGRTMTSKAGSFDNTKGVLHLEGETTLVDDDRSFFGESLIFETGTGHASFARGRAALPAGDGPQATGLAASGPLQITADQVDHDFKRRRTTFRGHVVATRGDVVVHAPRLVAVGGEDGKVERAWTEGGPVRVRQGERRGTARRAHFSADGKRLVLEGDPVVTEGESSLRGDRVTFLVGQGRVEVERPRAVFPLRRAQEGAKE